jgi:hypothetical protein
MQLYGGWDKTNERWVEARGKAISWGNVTALDFQINEDVDVCEIFLNDIKITK